MDQWDVDSADLGVWLRYAFVVDMTQLSLATEQQNLKIRHVLVPSKLQFMTNGIPYEDQLKI